VHQQVPTAFLARKSPGGMFEKTSELSFVDFYPRFWRATGPTGAVVKVNIAVIPLDGVLFLLMLMARR